MNAKVRAAALDFIKSAGMSEMDTNSQAFRSAYAAECRLFNEHFKEMSWDEKREYTEFVTWIDNSGLWKSDLTVDELYYAYLKTMILQ